MFIWYSDLILNVIFLIQTYDLCEHNSLYDLMFFSSMCFIRIGNLIKHFYRVHISCCVTMCFMYFCYVLQQDQVASPAEIAKAYMCSKSSKGSPLRLRLHDPSMPIKSMEASMIQKVKPPTIPLLQSSRLQTYKTSDRLESSYTTPNRSAIYKMSSSPYFKVFILLVLFNRLLIAQVIFSISMWTHADNRFPRVSTFHSLL